MAFGVRSLLGLQRVAVSLRDALCVGRPADALGVALLAEEVVDGGLSPDDAVPEIEGILRDAKRDPDLVAKAKANSDADFNADNTVVASVLSKFIDRREKSEEIVNALLKGQNMDTFAQLLAMLGFREYLATVDYHFPNENVAVEVEAQPSQSTAKVNEEAKA
ncbi:hypothetical protein CWN80_07160 [Janibacter hoylei PVAS-1]|uniref:Uncharacterized protein n=1 Tax=Janibacter hoylei PVAS-1 TaxID=1210046 RepID=A0A444B5F5_9MICO|nr:hypothetical protein [Janibacter hoylei]RWU83552.1 hypothetical protein CWN80_07160 [Janibacter hoylei PVAS-1]